MQQIVLDEFFFEFLEDNVMFRFVVMFVVVIVEAASFRRQHF